MDYLLTDSSTVALIGVTLLKGENIFEVSASKFLLLWFEPFMFLYMASNF